MICLEVMELILVFFTGGVCYILLSAIGEFLDKKWNLGEHKKQRKKRR